MLAYFSFHNLVNDSTLQEVFNSFDPSGQWIFSANTAGLESNHNSLNFNTPEEEILNKIQSIEDTLEKIKKALLETLAIDIDKME